MKRLSKVLFSAALILGLAVPAMAYEAFHGPLGVLSVKEGVSDGYVLICPQNSKTTYLIDNNGGVVREWVSEYVGFYAEMLPNGNMIRHSCPEDWWPNYGGGAGVMEEFDWDGNLVWQYVMYEEGQLISHHTFEVMPNGNYLILGWEFKSFEEAVANGLDTSDPKRMLTADGFRNGPRMIPGVWPDMIREVNHAGETVWEWHVWDHLGQGYDKFDINVYLDAVPLFPGIKAMVFPGPDWTHFNGVAFNPRTNQICFTSRNLGEVFVINYPSGEIVYRWGNPANYGQGEGPSFMNDGDQQLFGPHAPDWTIDNTITVMDNGTARPTHPYTRGLELDPATGQVLWDWGSPSVGAQTNNFYSAFQCGAQKIANGNWMITTSFPSHVVEVTADKEIVWEFITPVAEDQVYAASNFHGAGGDDIHKAMRYLADYPGFAGKSMEPLYQWPNWVETLSKDMRPL